MKTGLFISLVLLTAFASSNDTTSLIDQEKRKWNKFRVVWMSITWLTWIVTIVYFISLKLASPFFIMLLWPVTLSLFIAQCLISIPVFKRLTSEKSRKDAYWWVIKIAIGGIVFNALFLPKEDPYAVIKLVEIIQNVLLIGYIGFKLK